MTVVLIGVGADQTNSSPYPQIYDDGSFEYVPIPEGYESTESKTYGSIARTPTDRRLHRARGEGDTLADILTEIKPREAQGKRLNGEAISRCPIHHDPNFSELTYGEVKTANKNQLHRLGHGDIVAFYTGLTRQDSDTPHRYIIGYFTVDEITDFATLLGKNSPTDDQGRVVVSDLSPEQRAAVEAKLDDYAENAHVKRYQANGTIHPNLLIVDGTKPGGLLERAYSISQTVPGGHAFSEEAEETLRVESTSSGRKTGFLGGFKKAHRLNLTSSEFIDVVEQGS